MLGFDLQKLVHEDMKRAFADYLPGDLITCTVAGRLPHIAIVVPAPVGGTTPWIVHNIGQGPKGENRLFEFPLTGHYRFHPAAAGR